VLGRYASRTGCSHSVLDFRRFIKCEAEVGTINRAAYARVCDRPSATPLQIVRGKTLRQALFPCTLRLYRALKRMWPHKAACLLERCKLISSTANR
jgi:hypothetical protein